MEQGRLFKIVYHLLDKGRATAPELAEKFEVSVRTIYRDLDAISAAGIPIYTVQGKGGGIFILPEFVLEKSLLTPQEKEQILMALQGLAAAEDSRTDELLTKLGGLFRVQGVNWIEVDFSDWHKNTAGAELFDELKRAVFSCRRVSFSYFAGEGGGTVRTVEPVKLIFKSKDWYLYGFCLLRNDYRFFKLTRIKDLTLGMTNTHFVNACGLDEAGHLSTARDVALMSREMLLHHTEVRDYCSIWMDTLRGGATQLVNTNKLLKSYRGITGLKTGTTGQAGVCISASAERDGLRLIAVVLGSASGKERFQAASTLLDYGFAHYESAAAALPGDAPQTLPVEHGTAATVPLNYESPGHCLMPKGEGGTLEAVVELPASLSAPVAAGEQVGRIKILHQGTEMCSYPITAAQNVDALSFRYCLHLLAQSLLLRN